MKVRRRNVGRADEKSSTVRDFTTTLFSATPTRHNARTHPLPREMTSPPKIPNITPNGCGPIVGPVRGQPVQGKAVADTSEVLAWVDIKNDGDIALAGYDPVSYHAGADHGPLMGKAVHETIIETLLQGRVRYRFASEENMAKFRAEYRRYKPKYGGFCAAGVGLHETLGSGDPLVWAVDPRDGRLLLFCSLDMKAEWEKVADAARTNADERFEGLCAKASQAA